MIHSIEFSIVDFKAKFKLDTYWIAEKDQITADGQDFNKVITLPAAWKTTFKPFDLIFTSNVIF